MKEIMVKIDHISKRYKLGQIGGTTLIEELQRKRAKLRGREDPTRIIGSRDYQPGETFLALDDVSIEVIKGERIGIIGHNGAGKSTLLKLISRVTAPTNGMIGLNGRITSMLEVGTGFHGELTGRENIYMNGAILGMTKKEIDERIEEIIDFSEVRQFIDTPVKRYSSGMYVKLAFSVAAHLNSEIMIMDEVLAVGDMAFQNKCINKMNEVSKNEGRTILYVSHNMNTIRQLCDRCVVLDHGKIVYSGDVESAIEIYSEKNQAKLRNEYDTSEAVRPEVLTSDIYIEWVRVDDAIVNMGGKLAFELLVNNKISDMRAILRCVLTKASGEAVGMAPSDFFIIKKGKETIRFSFDVEELPPGNYGIDIILNEYNGADYIKRDCVGDTVAFKVKESYYWYNTRWQSKYWGNVIFNSIKVLEK